MVLEDTKCTDEKFIDVVNYLDIGVNNKISRDKILDKVNKLHKEKGMTIILVSHSMEDVAKYADRIVVMNKGSIFLDGNTKEVYAHYKELEEIGLLAPQVTYILNDLKEKGMDINTDITNPKEAAQEIIRVLKKA